MHVHTHTTVWRTRKQRCVALLLFRSFSIRIGCPLFVHSNQFLFYFHACSVFGVRWLLPTLIWALWCVRICAWKSICVRVYGYFGYLLYRSRQIGTIYIVVLGTLFEKFGWFFVFFLIPAKSGTEKVSGINIFIAIISWYVTKSSHKRVDIQKLQLNWGLESCTYLSSQKSIGTTTKEVMKGLKIFESQIDICFSLNVCSVSNERPVCIMSNWCFNLRSGNRKIDMGEKGEGKSVLSSKLSGGPHGLGKQTMKFILIERISFESIPNCIFFFCRWTEMLTTQNVHFRRSKW